MKNDWSNSAEFYDAILGKEYYVKSARFVAKILKKHHSQSVLELGCGTGLYLAPLKKSGFAIEGLDISRQMLKQAKPLDVPLYCADMAKFDLGKKYDAVLCLNSSLALLPNMRLISATITRCHKHLKKGGVLIIDVPNHVKEIVECDGVEETEQFKTKNGTLILKTKSYTKDKKWIEEWHGTVGKKKFTERFEELIFSPEKLESLLAKKFIITQMYGSRTGGAFTKKSYRRMYICVMK